MYLRASTIDRLVRISREKLDHTRSYSYYCFLYVIRINFEDLLIKNGPNKVVFGLICDEATLPIH